MKPASRVAPTKPPTAPPPRLVLLGPNRKTAAAAINLAATVMHNHLLNKKTPLRVLDANGSEILIVRY